LGNFNAIGRLRIPSFNLEFEFVYTNATPSLSVD
jgi:hypothetical protein